MTIGWATHLRIDVTGLLSYFNEDGKRRVSFNPTSFLRMAGRAGREALVSYLSSCSASDGKLHYLPRPRYREMNEEKCICSAWPQSKTF